MQSNQVVGDDLSISGIDVDALRRSAKQHGFSLHLRDTKEKGGDTVILSDTETLRRYFSAHPADIFGKPDRLKRQR